MEVPTKTSLADIYPGDAVQAQTTRWNSLLSTFKDTYGKSADFVSRSPGRVNIIGEVSYHFSKPILGSQTNTGIAH
jgi:galactokinase